MIFDQQYVTGLVIKWQKEQDPKILEVILDQSRSLIEAIVSGYDPFYRDDLIQEASLRVQYSLPYFDASRSSLHTFLTTVIKNICMTYLRKQSSYGNEYSLEIFEFNPIPVNDIHTVSDTLMLEELIVRNRMRFPSIPVCTIDEVSELVCDSLLYGMNKRATISKMVEIGIDKTIAEVLYNSSMLYLRAKHISNAKNDACDDEFSVCRDLQEIFGKELGTHISIIFSGMTLRL